MPKQKYASDVKLGGEYIDPQTGIEGTAVAMSFYQYACERVTLELVVSGKIEEYTFDAPRLVCAKTGARAATTRTGGPGGSVSDGPTRRGPVSR